MGVKTENELFAGFGKREIFQSLIGGILSLIISTCIYFVNKNVAIAVVIVLTGIFGSVMMTTRDINNQSVVDHLYNIFCFFKNQQIYPYRYQNEWR